MNIKYFVKVRKILPQSEIPFFILRLNFEIDNTLCERTEKHFHSENKNVSYIPKQII